jgi:hypothetical protein
MDTEFKRTQMSASSASGGKPIYKTKSDVGENHSCLLLFFLLALGKQKGNTSLTRAKTLEMAESLCTMDHFREKRRLLSCCSFLLLRLEFLYRNISRLFIINRSMYNSFYSSCLSCKRSIVFKQTCISVKGRPLAT